MLQKFSKFFNFQSKAFEKIIGTEPSAQKEIFLFLLKHAKAKFFLHLFSIFSDTLHQYAEFLSYYWKCKLKVRLDLYIWYIVLDCANSGIKLSFSCDRTKMHFYYISSENSLHIISFWNPPLCIEEAHPQFVQSTASQFWI